MIQDDELSGGRPVALVPEVRPTERPRARQLHVLLAALALLVCTGGPSTYVALHLHDGPETWRSWMYAVPFGAVAVGGVCALAVALRTVPRERWPWPLLAVGAYAGWALLSSAWSVERTTTVTAALTGTGIAAFGCWFGWRLRLNEQIWSIVLATGTAAVASALVVRYWPEYGKMTLPPELSYFVAPWQGIFANRNSLAPVCVLGLLGLVGLVLVRPSVRRGLAVIPFAIVEIVLLRNSGGITSQLTLLVMCACAVAVPVAWALRRRRVPGLAVGAVAAAAVTGAWFAFFANLDRLTSAVGRESNLSNRRLIWADVRGFIVDRPWEGHGFWAFWERADLTAASYARLNGAYASAHNSALEVLLGLGVVGLCVYLAIVLAAVAGIAKWAWGARSLGSWWWSILLVFLVTQNLLESFVLWHSYNWVLFVAACVVPFSATSSNVGPETITVDTVGEPSPADLPDATTERIPSASARGA